MPTATIPFEIACQAIAVTWYATADRNATIPPMRVDLDRLRLLAAPRPGSAELLISY